MTGNPIGGIPIKPTVIGSGVTETPKTDETKKTAEEEIRENLEEPYFEQKSVTISLIKNNSLFRKANNKVMPKRVDYIGSCITSSRVLCANKDEIEAYMPNIIGLAQNNENFITRVKQYFNNIQIKVDEIGKTFDTSFRWEHKKDYYVFKNREDKINDEYNAVPRNDTDRLEKALKIKINSLNALESEKYKYGTPNNVEDYLMYRHCLLYGDIAKELAFINSDRNYRFYFKDDAKEAERLRKFRNQVTTAKMNYVKCLADDELFDAVYIQFCAKTGLPVFASLAEDRIDREIKLDRFSQDEPKKFNEICNDKNIKTIALIEKLIGKGELVRLQYNQNITTPGGEVIGANMKEAVAWFKDPANSANVNAYMNKLSQM